MTPRCTLCDHVFDGRARYVFRGREKVLFLDVPVGGWLQRRTLFICQWCNAR